MWRDASRAEQAVRHVFADGRLGAKAAHAPMGLLGGACLQRPIQKIGHLLIIERAGASRTGLVTQAHKTLLYVAQSPFSYRGL